MSLETLPKPKKIMKLFIVDVILSPGKPGLEFSEIARYFGMIEPAFKIRFGQ